MNAFEGNNTNILLISDRLLEEAADLYNFLNKYDDINCHFIKSAEEFEPDNNGAPDFLITAGYLENFDNYRIVKRVREVNSDTYCLLWGMADALIRDHSIEYNFNDYFERRLPYNDLLNRLSYIQGCRINGFEFIEDEGLSFIKHENALYKISAYSTERIIKMRDLGIRPAVPSFSRKAKDRIYYFSEYVIKDNLLYLSNLRIAKTYGLFPSVNGVCPQINLELDDVYTYKNINLQTNYTGKIIVQNGHQKINKKAYTILNKLFGCKKLIQFTFENGNLIESKDLSEICRYIKHLSRIESILKLKRNLTPIQKRFLRERINYSELNKQETYNYYQNYFYDYSI